MIVRQQCAVIRTEPGRRMIHVSVSTAAVRLIHLKLRTPEGAEALSVISVSVCSVRVLSNVGILHCNSSFKKRFIHRTLFSLSLLVLHCRLKYFIHLVHLSVVKHVVVAY